MKRLFRSSGAAQLGGWFVLVLGAVIAPACSSAPAHGEPANSAGNGGSIGKGGSAGRGNSAGATDASTTPPPGGEAGKGGRIESDGDWLITPELDAGPIETFDATTVDGAGVYQLEGGADAVSGLICPNPIAAGCIGEVNEGSAGLCNGLDDDCDGRVDEGCVCTLGSVQPCFAGPPGRHSKGACQDGTQKCIRGTGEFGGAWGACTGGIPPSAEVCDGIDNDCNGCVDEIVGCIPVGTCPGPDDPRIPVGKPFTVYPLHGADFYPEQARSWLWQIEGGPCDNILANGQQSYELLDATSADARFLPRLSGDYTVTLTVITNAGDTFKCTWIVRIYGPGLRVELCYPESMTQDLDLFVKQPGAKTPWYSDPVNVFSPSDDQCDWHNCEARLRGGDTPKGSSVRANWGYANGSLSECSGGPQGDQWTALGYCANPRLDIDNNLSQGSGLPENINIDTPREGETFRIMVQNFSRRPARPIVNVYCGGHRAATYGAAPDQLVGYSGEVSSGVGAMWRVADVTTHVGADGQTTCDVVPLRLPNSTDYWVTVDDPSY